MPDIAALASGLCAQLSGDELARLRDDPVEAIPLIDPAVTIRVVSGEPGRGCSVEGLYHAPTRSITVQRASSERRTRFTAIHEFGHDRARRDVDVARYLASLGGTASRKAEERIADAFAAAVLIPNPVVDEVLGDEPASARSLLRLFQHQDIAGSREACCVRVAQRMRGEGYVVLAEGGVARFCATVGTAYSIARGTPQPQVGLLSRAAEHGYATDENAQLQYPDGRMTRQYAGQAVTDEIYTFAVLTDSSTPPWSDGWIAPRQAQVDAPEIFCLGCGEVTEAWQRCDTNSSHRVCGVCEWCECQAKPVKVAEKTCVSCMVLKRVDLFPGGGTVCRDCA